MGVIFFLKDGMRVDPSTLQILQNSSNLPMVAKPFCGILSDSCYIFGQHRVPYIALGAFLQAVSWIAIATFAGSGNSFFSITFYLLLGNLGASMVEVANDAMVVETAKQSISSKSPSASSGGGLRLRSFVWMASSIGGAMGNLIGGFLINWYSPKMMFSIYGILLCLQLLITSIIRESSLCLPKTPSQVSFKTRLSQLLAALKKPPIMYSILWFSFSYAIIPALTGTMFFFWLSNRHHVLLPNPTLEDRIIVSQDIQGIQAGSNAALGDDLYNSHLKSISSRIRRHAKRTNKVMREESEQQ